MFSVKITSGFEQDVRIVGRYETKAEAIAAARYLKSQNAGAYCVAIPAPAPIWTPEDFAQTVRDARRVTAERAATKRLLHSVPLTPEPRVDTAYWIQAEADALEDAADNFTR